MGAGKSTIAKLFSKNYIDLDEYVSKKSEMEVSEYINKKGISSFRKIEEESLKSLVDKYEIISTGGGIIESLQNQKFLLNENNVVYLKADFKCLLQRLEKDKINHRPFFEKLSTQDFEKLYHKRSAIYEILANEIIDTTDKSVDEVLANLKILFNKNNS